jgi:hypothetical protein
MCAVVLSGSRDEETRPDPRFSANIVDECQFQAVGCARCGRRVKWKQNKHAEGILASIQRLLTAH